MNNAVLSYSININGIWEKSHLGKSQYQLKLNTAASWLQILLIVVKAIDFLMKNHKLISFCWESNNNMA